MKTEQSTIISKKQTEHPESPLENSKGEENQLKEMPDTRGESGNLDAVQSSSAGPGESISGRNKTLEGVRQGRHEA